MKSAEIRLQKYIADAGICSRRAAETLIEAGDVEVNGKIAKIGQKVTPGADEVKVDGQRIRLPRQEPMTVAVHKPRGLVCSNDDPHNPGTVFDLLPPQLMNRRFFCAGRLDKDSEGLVILTTDGELANKLMHPRNVVVKRYHVQLEDSFPRSRLTRLIKGVKMEDEWFRVERASLMNPRNDASHNLDVWMHHGKKREIRQLFLALGFPVKRLRRYQIGGFPLKGIPLRAVMQLSRKDIGRLFQSPPAPKPAHDAIVIKPTRSSHVR
ncbi:MAG: pseudouridine synthase [Synoicihabitans sp.]